MTLFSSNSIFLVFLNFVFLPEFAEWHTLYPEAVRATPDFISGLPVAII